MHLMVNDEIMCIHLYAASILYLQRRMGVRVRVRVRGANTSIVWIMCNDRMYMNS